MISIDRIHSDLEALANGADPRRRDRADARPVQAGKVSPSQGVVSGQVPGARGEIYNVSINIAAQRWECSCPDARRGEQVGPCKHAISVALKGIEVIEAAWEREAEEAYEEAMEAAADMWAERAAEEQALYNAHHNDRLY